MQEIELRLQEHFSDIFRRVWVQPHSRSGQRDVLVTLFYAHRSGYLIISLRKLSDITFDIILGELQRRINIDELLEDLI